MRTVLAVAAALAAMMAAPAMAEMQTKGSVTFDYTRGPADAAQKLFPQYAGATLAGYDFLRVYAKTSNPDAGWMVYSLLCDGMETPEVKTRKLDGYGNSALFVVESDKACRVWVDPLERQEFAVTPTK